MITITKSTTTPVFKTATLSDKTLDRISFLDKVFGVNDIYVIDNKLHVSLTIPSIVRNDLIQYTMNEDKLQGKPLFVGIDNVLLPLVRKDAFSFKRVCPHANYQTEQHYINKCTRINNTIQYDADKHARRVYYLCFGDYEDDIYSSDSNKVRHGLLGWASSYNLYDDFGASFMNNLNLHSITKYYGGIDERSTENQPF